MNDPRQQPAVATRVQGVIRRWIDERGFGFIDDGADGVFVHVNDVSGFPRPGAEVTYEIGTGTDGRPRALLVVVLEDNA
jgi:cold shock CspA family protein